LIGSGYFTFRKYLFALSSGRTTETFAVFVQAEIPHDSAELTFVPVGRTCEAGVNASRRQRVKSILTLDNGFVQREIPLDP